VEEKVERGLWISHSGGEKDLFRGCIANGVQVPKFKDLFRGCTVNVGGVRKLKVQGLGNFEN